MTYSLTASDTAIKEGATVNMPKNIHDSCVEINRLLDSIKKAPQFINEYGLKDSAEMVAELSNPVFVAKLKHTYPTKWDDFLSCICRMLDINKSFSYYDKLKKAVDEIVAHPDYQIAIGYFLHEKTYYLEEFQSCDTSLIPL